MSVLRFPINVAPLRERQVEIEAKSIDPSVERQAFYLLGNQKQMLPVVRLSIGLPTYRMANYRTQTAQMRRIREEQLPATFFSAGEESTPAQKIQHEILVGYAHRGSGDTIIPVYDALEDGVQTQPLLLTSTGVVVNGNRRLAAMRELYAISGGAYNNFGSVDAMILPSTVRMDEIRVMEVTLQMQPQTLLPYEWVDEALALRELRDVHGLTLDDIARYKRMDQPADITKLIQQLEYAEDYLSNYLGHPTEYEMVADNKQQFQDIQKNLSGRTGSSLSRCRQIAYILTKNSTKLGRRAYDYNAAFGRKSDDVLDALATQFSVEVNDSAVDEESADIFDTIEATTDPYADLEPILSDVDRSEELALAIKAVVDRLREDEDETNRGQAALKNVLKANTALSEVDLTSASADSYAGVAAQLRNVQARCNALIASLETLSAAI